MKQLVLAGVASKRMAIFIQDSSATTGAGLTGLTNASSGLTWYYYREDNTASHAVSVVGQTLGTWTSGGFKEIDATNLPGFYELGVPNVVTTATGSPAWVVMGLKGAANMVPVNIELEFVHTDPLAGVDVATWLGTAVTAATGGIPDVNVKRYNNQVSVTDANNLPKVDVEDFGGAAGTFTTGQPKVIAASGTVTGDVNVIQWLGTSVTAATGGIPDVNVKNINNVSGASVTTVAANVGTTQPIAFTGVGTAALVKSDMVDVAGAAVSATTAQLGVNVVKYNNQTAQTDANLLPKVDVEDFGGAAGTFTAGVPNATAAVSGTMTANVVSWLGTAVTAAAGGVPDVNVKNWNNHLALSDANNIPKVDVEDYGGVAGTFASGKPTVNATLSGTMSANVVQWLGNPVASVNAGYPDVNTKYYDGQPTQVDANGLPNMNVTDWNGDVIPAINIPGIPVVDLGAWGGSGIGFQDFPLVTVAENLDKTDYVLAAGGITVRKNTAFSNFTFPMFSATTNALLPGLSVSVTRSVDGGSMAGATNSVSAVGSGIYKINLSAADLNGDSITFVFTATGALDSSITIVTQP